MIAPESANNGVTSGTLVPLLVIGIPGGATAAGLLARAGLDVTLLDRSEFPREKTCGDALTPRAVAVLSELGLLDALRPDAISVDRLEVVGPAGGSLTIPLKAPPGVVEPCLVVRRHMLDDTIRRWAEKGGARFVAPARANRVEGDADGACVFGHDHDGPMEWHARAAIMTMRSGKDLYCEKPGTMTVAEGREVVETARRYGRIFQTGAQRLISCQRVARLEA